MLRIFFCWTPFPMVGNFSLQLNFFFLEDFPFPLLIIIKGLPHEVQGPKDCGLWTGARHCPPHRPICCRGHCDTTDQKCRPPGLSYVTKRVDITKFFGLGCVLFFNDKKHPVNFLGLLSAKQTYIS